MALVRCLCDKACVFNENGQCVSPEMPRWTTPEEITVETVAGEDVRGSNDKYSTCDRFVKKG